MTFTGVTPQTSVFGDEELEGILVAKANIPHAPGGFVFCTRAVFGNAAIYTFIWCSTTGVLRIVDCTPETGTVAIYDPGSNQMTFTAFDQDASGAAVGSQT